MNTKSLFVAVTAVAATVISMNASAYTVVNEHNEPIDSVFITGFNQQVDSIASYMTDSCGHFVVTDNNVCSMLLEHPHYSSRLYDPRKEKSGGKEESDTIRLGNAVALGEVNVNGDIAERYLQYTTYRIPRSAMDRYQSFYQAMNELPGVLVLQNGSLYYNGESNVVILLDGVATTRQELSGISKDDIANIRVYDVPPARFAITGAGAVIDVITKSGLTGGNGSLQIDQAFKPLIGNNAAMVYYNYKKSKFSLSLDNSNKHYSKFRRNELLRYEVDGQTYEKEKTGHDSKRLYDNNSITAGYQINKNGDFLYNAKVGSTFNRLKHDALQTVTTNDDPYLANNLLKTRYSNIWTSQYFEKSFGENEEYGKFLINVLYQRFNTHYKSHYLEYADLTDMAAPSVDEQSNYNTDYDAVTGQAQYQFPQKRWGQVSIVMNGSYRNSRYSDPENPFKQETSNIMGLLQYYGSYRNFYGVAFVGIENANTSSIEAKNNLLTPSFRADLTYIPLPQKCSVTFTYDLSTTTPSIAMLSETDQWLDTKLTYHGNRSLRPYRTHTFSLRGVFSTRYIYTNLRMTYEKSPDKICSHYYNEPGRVLETLVNLKRYESLSAYLSLQVMPLGNRKWYVAATVNAARLFATGENYKWAANRYQLMITSGVNLSKWNFSAFYQYPGKILDGQLINPRGKAWYVSAAFRPINDLSIGVNWWLPFGKHFKESSHTIPEAIAYTNTVNDIRDFANYVALNFSWNFSFGKRRNNARPAFSTMNDDTGILTR